MQKQPQKKPFAWFLPVSEFLPIIAFFVAFLYRDLLTATAVLVGTSVVLLPVTFLLTRQIPTKQLITTAVIVLFGSAALLLNDERYIKIKPTVVTWLMAATLFITERFVKIHTKRPIQFLLGTQLQLTDKGWRRLSDLWSGCLIIVGLSNEYVWRTYTTDFWVSYKVFGLPIVTVILMMACIAVITRKHKNKTDPQS